MRFFLPILAAVLFLATAQPDLDAACGSGRAGLFSGGGLFSGRIFSGRLFDGGLFNRSRSSSSSSSSVTVRTRTVAVAEAVPVAPQAAQTQQTTSVRTRSFSRTTSNCGPNGCVYVVR